MLSRTARLWQMSSCKTLISVSFLAGAENHLFLVDVTKVVENGKVAQNLLDEVNITLNKNSIPYETLSPFKTSGIRIGSAAITARGFGEEESRKVLN